MGIAKEVEKVSSASARITVKSSKPDSLMEDVRKEAVTHHASTQENNNAEFLVTDRIMVTFKKPASNDVLSSFIAKYTLSSGIIILTGNISLDKYQLRNKPEHPPGST